MAGRTAQRKSNRGKPADRTAPPTVLLYVQGEDATRLRRNLQRWQYAVHAVPTADAALEALHGVAADIVMLGGQPPEALSRVLRTVRRLAPAAKCLVLTAAHDERTLRRLVNRGGADAVLEHPPEARELRQTLARLVDELQLQVGWASERGEDTALAQQPAFEALVADRVRERTQQLEQRTERLGKALQKEKERNRSLRRLNASLKIQSTTDPLTSLFNRREFQNRLRVEWGRYRRYHRPLSLVMLDIDHFKVVNDTYGHDCGDAVLVGLAGLIRRHQRSHDINCRYGGEEFMVLMPETPLAAGFHVAEGLRQLVARQRFTCGEHHLRVHISLGVVGAMEHAPANADAFIQLADQAMYAAKRHGRNRTVIIDRHDPERVLRETPAEQIEP